MNVDIKKVERFFFKAMVLGWAGNGKYVEIPGRSGYKRFVFSDGDFHLCDEYCVNKVSKKSFGTTTIWLGNVPVWVMSYGGWYDDFAAELVKKALLETYQKMIFMGGRGPAQYYPEGNKFIYLNATRSNNFSRFSGREDVIGYGDCNDEGGYHEYWGMSLI